MAKKPSLMNETQEKIECCATCRFIGNDLSSRMHICRKRAPEIVLTTVGVISVSQSEWPHVNADDWCGEYKMERG